MYYIFACFYVVYNINKPEAVKMGEGSGKLRIELLQSLVEIKADSI